MLKTIKCSNLNYQKKLNDYIINGNIESSKRTNIVSKIIKEIRHKGDSALIKYSKTLDKSKFKHAKDLIVTKREIKEAKKECSKEFKEAISIAIKRITNYQKKLLPKDFFYKDNVGIKLGCIWSPLSSCGLYVPGGKAFYPSSVLMNAIPAKIAGVNRIVITTPVSNKFIRPEILVAADALGIKEIYKVGGAQAIAAMAYGTENIKKVDKIVGPGNAFVAEAKKQVFGYVGIDSIAGPSEVLIIADKLANPKWIAIDLLSQAEHDENARAILVTDDKNLLDKVNFYIKEFLNIIDRKLIARKSIDSNGLAILINDIDKADLVTNYIAPEHLQIMSKNKKSLLKKITNAGAIFFGEYSPEALGDYIAGPSHVLPTSGNSRFESGLSVLDFLKRTSYIEANKKGLAKVLKPIKVIGKSEGLDAHVRSATIRFSKGD